MYSGIIQAKTAMRTPAPKMSASKPGTWNAKDITGKDPRKIAPVRMFKKMFMILLV